MAEIAKADKGRKCPARAALTPAARADVTAGDRSENCAHIGLERPNQSSRQPPRSLENKSRTGCYRFATQLSVTGGDRTGRQEAKANEIKCVPRLANTAWDRTNGSYTIKEWAA